MQSLCYWFTPEMHLCFYFLCLRVYTRFAVSNIFLGHKSLPGGEKKIHSSHSARTVLVINPRSFKDTILFNERFIQKIVCVFTHTCIFPRHLCFLEERKFCPWNSIRLRECATACIQKELLPKPQDCWAILKHSNILQQMCFVHIIPILPAKSLPLLSIMNHNCQKSSCYIKYKRSWQ